MLLTYLFQSTVHFALDLIGKKAPYLPTIHTAKSLGTLPPRLYFSTAELIQAVAVFLPSVESATALTLRTLKKPCCPARRRPTVAVDRVYLIERLDRFLPRNGCIRRVRISPPLYEDLAILAALCKLTTRIPLYGLKIPPDVPTTATVGPLYRFGGLPIQPRS